MRKLLGNGTMEPRKDMEVEPQKDREVEVKEEEIKMPTRGHVKNLIRLFSNGLITGRCDSDLSHNGSDLSESWLLCFTGSSYIRHI